MCNEDIQGRMLACLERLEAHFEGDDYEAGGYFIVGGPTDTYILKSPYNTECEWTPVSIVSLGGVGKAIVSQNSATTVPPGNGSVGFGSSSQGSDTNPLEGLLVTAPSNNASPLPILWSPLSKGASLYINVLIGAGFSCFLTVAFRRKLTHLIPDTPRQRPHTHSHMQSRAALRRLAAMSPMTAGFEGRYPVPGGAPYHQMGTPTIPQRDTGIVPISQDTGVHGTKSSDGIMPNIIPPTRKMGRKRGS